MTLNISLAVVNQVRDLAKRAGDEIMNIFNTGFEVETKDDSSPVTEADRVAESLIIRTIRGYITDSLPIVGEEAFAAGNAPDVAGKSFWLVDALDGTKEFIRRGNDFTVNIALIENARPILGVVYAPATDDAYWGSIHGAFAETGGEQPRKIACRQPAADGLVAVVSRSHRTSRVDDYLKRFTVKKEISSGSSLKFCQVAVGGADIYPRLGRTMEWDTAAGHAVLRFAGGRVIDLEDNELRYGKPGFENPDFVAWGAQEVADKA